MSVQIMGDIRKDDRATKLCDPDQEVMVVEKYGDKQRESAKHKLLRAIRSVINICVFRKPLD